MRWSFESPGFKRLQREGILLDVDQAQELDVTLDVGDVKDTVEVTANAALVDTESAETGQVVDSHAVTNLPLNERNPWRIDISVHRCGRGVDDYRRLQPFQQRRHQWRKAGE